MGTAHQETGHGHDQRGTTEPQVALGQAAGGGSKVGAAAYAAQAVDPREWMLPPTSNPWKRRISAGLITGLLGILGWIGFKQLPNTVNAASDAPSAQSEDSESLEDMPPEEFESFSDQPRTVETQTIAAVNPFAETSAIAGHRGDAAPAPFQRAARAAAASVESNPFAGKANSARPVAVRGENPLSPADHASLAAEHSADAFVNEAPVIPREGDSTSTVAADFADQAQPETTSGESAPSDPFSTPVTEVAEEPSNTDDEVLLVEATDTTQADAKIQEQTPQPTVSPPLTDSPPKPAPSESAEIGFQFDEPVASEQPANGFEIQEDAGSTAPTDQGGFRFEAPAAQEPATGPAFGDPTVEPPTPPPFDEPAAEPRSFAAPFEPQEITPATAMANDPAEEKVHVVQPGENYWSIARHHYSAGRYFSALAEYNKPRIPDAKRLKPGMKVLIPSAATLESRFAKLLPAGPAGGKLKGQPGFFVDAQGRPCYRVGETDTLGAISQRHLGRTSRWTEIYELNRDKLRSPDALKLGMILKMPEDASQVAPAAALPLGR